MALTKVTHPANNGSEQLSGTTITDLIATVERVQPLDETRKNLICLDEDAEIFAEPSPSLIEAEAKFWEGR